MKKILIIVLVIAMSLTGCSQTENRQSDKPVVYTTIYPLYALAQPIAGDLVDLRMALPMGADPHDFEPSAKLVGAMQAADVIIYNGAGMEPWIDDILKGATNDQLIVKKGEDAVKLLTLVDNHGHNHDEHGDQDHGHSCCDHGHSDDDHEHSCCDHGHSDGDHEHSCCDHGHSDGDHEHSCCDHGHSDGDHGHSDGDHEHSCCDHGHSDGDHAHNDGDHEHSCCDHGHSDGDHAHNHDAHGDDDHAHANEHDHVGNIDPHIWLDPVNAKALSKMIHQTLSEVVTAEQSAQLTQNYQQVITRLDALDQQYQQTLADLPKREIVVGHAAFGYLCHRYQLSQISIAGLSTLEEPSAALLAEITEIAKEHQVNTIFYDGTGSAKLAEVIATEINVSTAPLYPLGTMSTQMIENGDDYFTVMEKNLSALKSALSE